MVQTYKEYKVVYFNDKLAEKTLTKRGTVRISAQTAKINNFHSKSTGFIYELVEEKKKPVARKKSDTNK